MIYLDNAATTFYKPPAVVNAVHNAMCYLSVNAGRGGHAYSIRGGALVENTREKIADMLHTTPSEVVFTHNCTHALNLAIMGCLQKGDHVVTSVFEHNSVLRPLYTLKERVGITLTVLAPQNGYYITPAEVEAAISDSTRMVVLNYVNNTVGTANPVAEIAKVTKRRGVWFLVDAAQSAGILPLDMRWGVDAVAFPAHKGLHGPQGCGVLALRGLQPTPIFAGGTGSDSHLLQQPQYLPESLECGTLNLFGIAGLNAAVELYRKNGEQNRKKIADLTQYGIEALRRISGVRVFSVEHNGIIAFRIAHVSSEAVSDALNADFGIATRSGLHCAPLAHSFLSSPEGLVRASVAFNNTKEELDALAQAVQYLAKNLN